MVKAQVGIEYMAMFAILLLVLTPVLLYALDLSSTSISSIKTREAVQTMANAADKLYNFGGGRTYVDLDLPSGVKNYTIVNKTIILTMSIGNSTGNAVAMTRGNVTGSLKINEGPHRVYLEYLSSGVINITGT